MPSRAALGRGGRKPGEARLIRRRERLTGPVIIVMSALRPMQFQAQQEREFRLALRAEEGNERAARARNTAGPRPVIPDRSHRPSRRPTAPQILELADGDTLNLHVAPVAKRLHDSTVRMLGYNGSIPGPTLHVQQGSEVIVHVTNDGDLDTTVHWHGLRLENKYDGVPHETQQPIPIGGSFTYRIQFPDPGLYWYHPHIREDYTQEMGLYGNIIVEPSEPGYWPAANRDVVLTLDDVLLEDGKIATFSVAETSYAAMGRYGNLLLIGGQTDLAVTARAGEVLRLWLTNTANTRVFNVRLPGARMKLIGGDSGRVEREEFVSEVLLAPSERAVVDVLLDQPGELTLEHQTPNRTYPLASISVAEEPAEPSLTDQFQQLRTAPELAAERRQLDHWLAAAPDKILALVAEMDDPTAPQPGTGPTVYACPMHPDVTSDQPGRCPQCGMKLLATATPAAAVSYACPMHPEVTSDQPGRCPTVRDEAARSWTGHPSRRRPHGPHSSRRRAPSARPWWRGATPWSITAWNTRAWSTTAPMRIPRALARRSTQLTRHPVPAMSTERPTASNGKTTWWPSTG